MIEDNLNKSLQENILILLCYHKKEIPVIINNISTDLFESSIYRDIVVKAKQYYDQFKEPISIHLADEFDYILNPKRKTRSNLDKAKLYDSVLKNLHSLKNGVNVEYVKSKIDYFLRQQTLKQGIIKAHEQLMKGNVDDAEITLSRVKQKRVSTFDPGIFIGDVSKVLETVSRVGEERFSTGIKELDMIGACPERKALYLFAALPGYGKTQHVGLIGKTGLLHKQKVLHVSLEMSTSKVLVRYLMSLFAISKRIGEIWVSQIELDDLGKIKNIIPKKLESSGSFEDRNIFKILRKKLLKLKNPSLIVKDFPTASLSIPEFKSYLENLINYSNFHPDIIIIDYADLMSIDDKNFRISLKQNLEKLRGISMEYNCAMITAAQINREGRKSDILWLTEQYLAEDFSKMNTADVLITYNQTVEEKEKNLARLLVVKNRDDISGLKILITQSYQIGQAVLDSYLMKTSKVLTKKYWDIVKKEKG